MVSACTRASKNEEKFGSYGYLVMVLCSYYKVQIKFVRSRRGKTMGSIFALRLFRMPGGWQRIVQRVHHLQLYVFHSRKL